MFQRKHTAIALLCLAVLLLWGCHEQETDPTITESQVWETMPPLTYGVLEYEKLEVLPWYCGRTEATGSGRWTETKAGYYQYYHWKETLFYGDKSDTLNWVPVCAKPQCTHPERSYRCNAYLSGNTFIARNGRIYFSSDLSRHPELYKAKGNGRALYSKAMDGTDIRLEYVIEEALITGGGQVNVCLMPDGWLYNSIKLNTDGTSTATCYYLSDLGLQILFRETYEDAGAAQTAHVIAPSPFCGDGSRMFTNTLLGSGVYWVENGKAAELPGAADYTDAGGYLSGSILRQFRCNEGYYDIDLQTGEEILLSDPRLENSRSFILLPNCILETTLGSEEYREGDPHAMALFDGKDWRTVALPGELTEAFTADMTVTVGAVTSDRILLLVYENQRFSRCSVYQILLGNRNLTLEPCGKLG